MGKKNRKESKESKESNDAHNEENNDTLKEIISINKELPFVSVCTPTFNRRPFIEYMIKCFLNQDYPKDKMEWIIIDDGTDKISDLIKDVKCVKYYKYDNKMSLGKKRNIMHEKSKGDIIVYMDDDDYYPPERVSHAVITLLKDPKALCAGSSEIYIYFKHIQKLYQFGPYSPNHATAGTFAFKKELLKDHSYEDGAALAEEKHFLKNYTVPFVQLDPLKTILVISHNQNTFDKKHLLVDSHDERFCKESDKNVDMFVKEQNMKDFYLNKIDKLLVNYEPGKPCMKPDVLQQMLDIERERRRYAEKHVKNGSGQITISTADGKQQVLNNDQIVSLLRQNQEQLKMLANLNNEKDKEIRNLKNNSNKDESFESFIKFEPETIEPDTVEPHTVEPHTVEPDTNQVDIKNSNYRIKYYKIKKENKRLRNVLLKELENKLNIQNNDSGSDIDSESDTETN